MPIVLPRRMKVVPRGAVQALVALTLLVACGSPPSATVPSSPTSSTPSPTSTPGPTSSPHVSPQPQPSPTPHAVLDDTFGFIVRGGVRTESDPLAGFVLPIGNGGGVVSPDGRQLAFWAKNVLRVTDVVPNAQARTLLTVSTKGEYSLYMAWSSDGTGIVVGVNGGGGGAADAPPGYTALRAVDAAGGQVREIVRIKNANLLPLSWDRQARLITAYEPVASGTINYDTVTEDGIVKRTPPGSQLYFLQASQDAKYVFGRNFAPPKSGPFDITNVLRVWPAGSYAAGVELRSAGGERILAAEWRPGTAEIAVLFDRRLEFWTASGGRRALTLPPLPPLEPANPNAGLLFRVDGKAVLIARSIDTASNVYVIAVDITSGRTEVVDWPSGMPGPGISVRIS